MGHQHTQRQSEPAHKMRSTTNSTPAPLTAATATKALGVLTAADAVKALEAAGTRGPSIGQSLISLGFKPEVVASVMLEAGYHPVMWTPCQRRGPCPAKANANNDNSSAITSMPVP